MKFRFCIYKSTLFNKEHIMMNQNNQVSSSLQVICKEKFLKQTIANAYKNFKQIPLLLMLRTQNSIRHLIKTQLISQKMEILNIQIQLSLSTQQGNSAVSTLDGADTTETKQKQQYMEQHTLDQMYQYVNLNRLLSLKNNVLVLFFQKPLILLAF